MRKRYARMVVLIVILALVVAANVSATSLFKSSSSSMFADQKAREVGDLVTVLIVERSQATQSAGVNTSSGTDTTFGASGVLADLLPMLGFSTGGSFSASGSTNVSGNVTGQLTTRVVEVMSNGTMRIEGRQGIVVNDEEQEIVISGWVRSRDIQPDNTIRSPLVADAQINFTGTGPISEEQKQGLLTRILRWIF